MLKHIEEYILSTRQERRSHLKLNEPCDERGGFSSDCRALLAYILKTTIPSNRKIFVCHACHNPICTNPYHVYWGTHKDNAQDSIENGTYMSGWQRMVLKYGINKAHEVVKERGKNSKPALEARARRAKREIENAQSN